MQQGTAARPDPVTRPYGRYELTAQITVDGGYSITTMTRTGGNREHGLCFTVVDRDAYRTIYAVIREGGLNNVHPAGVRDAICDALTRDLHEAQRRRDTDSRVRADYLNDLLDGFESPVNTAKVDELIESLSQTTRPRTFRELRDTHAAAAARDRAQRKAARR